MRRTSSSTKRGQNARAARRGVIAVTVVMAVFAWREVRAQRLDATVPQPSNLRPNIAVFATMDARVSLDASSPDARSLLDARSSGRVDSSLTDLVSRDRQVNVHCPDGMKLVDGDYCINVEQRCRRWLDPDEQMRCEEFAPTLCYGQRRRHLSFCMDTYEWPNRVGEYPQVRVTWYEARRLCESVGKRLCTEREWTLACEGEESWPYLYGYRRDSSICHFDHQTRRPDRGRLANPATAADEYARLYEAVPSGTYSRCTSPFGLQDLTGNVDEWTVNESGRPFQSALKGGWWGPIRARCRPATYSHNETFIYYQIGFRCCSAPLSNNGG
jgi:hypothetical protein